MSDRPLTVTTVADARAGLSAVLRRFRADPGGAQPVVLGSHRKPEAVIVPFARYELIAFGDAVGGDGVAGEAVRGAALDAGADAGADAGPESQHPGPASGAAAESAWEAPGDRATQIERWLSALDVTLATAAEIVDRGRDAFRADAALPLACEALAARVAELARLLVTAQPERFDDPMWSLAARNREIVVHHYNRVDEQSMWVAVAEGLPEIADLVARAREA